MQEGIMIKHALYLYELKKECSVVKLLVGKVDRIIVTDLYNPESCICQHYCDTKTKRLCLLIKIISLKDIASITELKTQI